MSTPTAAEMVAALTDARRRLAESGVDSVTVDGISTKFTSAGQLDDALAHWQRRAARVARTRPVVSSIDLTST
jgi:hypothetical protein